MNPQEVQQTADKLEKVAERGDVDTVAKELHDMAPDDRKAIAAKIKEDQKEKSSDGLPKLEFYDTGDVKSAKKHTVLDDTNTKYDIATGNKTEMKRDTWDGRSETETFDPNTGKETSETIINTDGSYVQRTFNPNTGYFRTEQSQSADGKVVRVEGNELSGDLTMIEFDKQGRVAETSGEDFTTRKFHYDENGKLDQIDGKLGHWDRSTDANGKTAWTNKNTGAVWHGEFNVDKSGDLHFKTANGTSHTFNPGDVAAKG